MSGRGNRNASGKTKDKEKDQPTSNAPESLKKKQQKPMATWSEIVDASGPLADIFGSQETFRHANLEEKLDLMMAAIMKGQKSMDDKFDSMSKRIFMDDDSIQAGVFRKEEEYKEEKCI